MSLVTLLWSIIATVAFMLGMFCAVAWLFDRRDFAYPTFCLMCVAAAACVPFELGMMHAATAAAYGEWLRWYQVPTFFVLIGQLLFVRFYLGTGRPWLLWTIIAARLFVLAGNFSVDPNFNFREIASLDHLEFLGEQISVVGDSEPRSWQWLASASLLLVILYTVDAAIRRWRKGGSESRRKALVVSLALAVPLLCSHLWNVFIVVGVLHVPVSNTIWVLGMLAITSYELGREYILSRRARLQLGQLRGELAQLERVNTLGRLASGLAHELTQPLSAVGLNIDTALRRLESKNPDLEELREVVGDIQRDTRRLVDVIEHMRALFKRGTLEVQPLALDGVVRDALALVRPEAVSRNVVVECNVQPGLPRVSGDRVHISQVLLNLVLNAIDAVQSRPKDRRHVVIEAQVASTGGIEIAVKDTGIGIPDDKLEEVFDPLFTTKPGSLGMGLALSRTIVDAHGGRLWAKNGLDGSDAAFFFTLPLA